MLDFDQLQATLIEEGRVQVFLRNDRDSACFDEVAHAVLDAYPDRFIIWQSRQNDRQDFRIILADVAEERLLMSERHPYHEELATLEAAYNALFACLEALDFPRDNIWDSLEALNRRQEDALLVRPHPSNPYVPCGWMAGKVR